MPKSQTTLNIAIIEQAEQELKKSNQVQFVSS